jgi:hypothetical protein
MVNNFSGQQIGKSGTTQPTNTSTPTKPDLEGSLNSKCASKTLAATFTSWKPTHIDGWKKMYQEDERLSLAYKLALQQKNNSKAEFQIYNNLLY